MEGLLGFLDPLCGVGITGDFPDPGKIQRMSVGIVGGQGITGEIQGFSQGQLVRRIVRFQGNRLSGFFKGALRITRAGWPSRGPRVKQGQRPGGPAFLQLRISRGGFPEEFLNPRQSVEGRGGALPGLHPERRSQPVLAHRARWSDAQAPLTGLDG